MYGLIILADDLTGCSDVSSFFADYNLKVLIVPFFKYKKLNYKADVLIFNTQSRHISQRESYRRNLFILKNYKAEKIYKKFDSTLRGNLYSETKSLLSFLYTLHLTPYTIIPLCFAFPEQKRTTLNGIHYVNNKPISKTEFSKDPLYPVKTSKIKEIFKDIKDKIEILDARTRGDLDKLAFKFKNYNILGGASGWLKSLIPLWFGNKRYNRKQKAKPQNSKHTVIISGSKNKKTYKQIKYFLNNLKVSKEEFPEIIYIDKDVKIFPEKAMRNLTKVVKDNIKGKRNFIICGGETSYNILKILKIKVLYLKGKVEYGIAKLCYKNYNFILKPGGFGREDILLRSYYELSK